MAINKQSGFQSDPVKDCGVPIVIFNGAKPTRKKIQALTKQGLHKSPSYILLGLQYCR